MARQAQVAPRRRRAPQRGSDSAAPVQQQAPQLSILQEFVQQPDAVVDNNADMQFQASLEMPAVEDEGDEVMTDEVDETALE